MSTESGVEYIKKVFSYNLESNIYYKKIVGEYILAGKFTWRNVDIYKLREMPESPEDIEGELVIYSFDPDNPEHCQRMNNLLKK